MHTADRAAAKQLGAVYLESNDAATRFTEDDLRVLVSMAQIAGQAVEYAHEHEKMSHAH